MNGIGNGQSVQISLITCTGIAIQTELLLTYPVYIYTHMIYLDLLLHSYVPPDP